jgi:hypothetical protein
MGSDFVFDFAKMGSDPISSSIFAGMGSDFVSVKLGCSSDWKFDLYHVILSLFLLKILVLEAKFCTCFRY